jgi:hypothetical protein
VTEGFIQHHVIRPYEPPSGRDIDADSKHVSMVYSVGVRIVD